MGIREEKIWINSQLKRIKNREFDGSNPAERNIARTLAELHDCRRWIHVVGATVGINLSWLLFGNIVDKRIKILSTIGTILFCREYAYTFIHEELADAVNIVMKDYKEPEEK